MAEKSLSAKKAPRRSIIDIVRSGDWGEVEYRHRLSCGHTIVRKRSSTAFVLACVDCLKAAAFSRGVLPERETPDEAESFAGEIKDLAMQSSLAGLLDVSPEAVDIVTDSDGNVRYGLIFLSADEIARLTSSHGKT